MFSRIQRQPAASLEKNLNSLRYSSPSPVRCSLISVSHTVFGASAVNLWVVRPWWSTLARRSSWTGGPALRFRPRFLACTDHSRWVEQSRQTRLSETRCYAFSLRAAQRTKPRSDLNHAARNRALDTLTATRQADRIVDQLNQRDRIYYQPQPGMGYHANDELGHLMCHFIDQHPKRFFTHTPAPPSPTLT